MKCIVFLLILSLHHAINSKMVSNPFQMRFDSYQDDENVYREENNLLQDDPKWLLHYTSDVDNRARCLDGTPGVFYTSLVPTNSSNSDKWILSMMWGGWCSLDVPIDWRDEHTVDHCYHRSFMYKGTSKGRQPSADRVGERYCQIRDAEANPTFYDWNYVYIPYCDGTSLTGRRDESLILDGPRGKRELFFRGGYIREAIANMLLPMGLANASVLVISGSSAGGLAALMQSDWWAERVVPKAKVLGLIDYGFFPSYDFDNSSNREVAPYQYASNLTEFPLQSYVAQIRMLRQRSNADVHERCAQAMGAGEAWQCMLGKTLRPFIRTPMFLLGSLYDSWQLENELGFISDAPRVAVHGRLVYQDHLDFLTLPAADGAPPPGHGAFLHSCCAHLGQWFLDIDGTDMRRAVDHWLRWHLAPTHDKTPPAQARTLRRTLPPAAAAAAAEAAGAPAAPPAGVGYLLWLQNRTYPCSDCCAMQPGRPGPPPVRRGGSAAAEVGAGAGGRGGLGESLVS